MAQPLVRLALVLCLLAVVGCSKGSSSAGSSGRRIEGTPLGPGVAGGPSRSETVLEVVATTSVTADWLRLVGGTNVRTHVVVKAGIDPVSYLATPRDIDAVHRADLVVATGRGLEPWLDGVREQAGRRAPAVRRSGEGQARVVTLTDGLAERTTASGAPDPFAWLDLANAKQMVAALATALIAADQVDEAAFSAARDAYSVELDRADQDLRRVLGPVEGRGLVTAKETFGWFAARYGLESVGAVVPSPNAFSDPSAAHHTALLQAVQVRQVKALFAETSVPDLSVRTLARDAGVKAVTGSDALLGDSLGPAGSGTDTFLGAVRHNARVVAANLA